MFWLLADKYNCSLGCRLCFCAPSCCFAGVFPLSPMAKPLFKDIVSVLCGSLRTLNSGTLLKTEAHKNHSLYIWGFSFTQPPWAIVFSSDQFSSVAQSCPTLCDPMNHSTPGLPVQHQLPEFTQWTSQWCHPAISSSVIPFSYYPQSLPASESFPMSQLFTWGGQSTGVSALAFHPPNEHPGLISVRMNCLDLLAVQGTLKSSPTPQFKSINSSALSFLHSPILTSIHDHRKNHSLD